MLPSPPPSPSPARRAVPLLACLALFALAAAIRLPRVWTAGATEGGGDEWFTAWRSLQVLFERGNPGNFLHPALFYDAGAAVYAGMYAAGRATATYADPVDLLAAFVLHERAFLEALQTLAADAGALTVPAVFELGRRAFGPRAGLAAAALLLVLPLHVEYSQRLRVDSLAALCTTLAGLALFALDRGARPRHYAVAGALVGLSTAANYPGALLLVPLALVHARLRRVGRIDARAWGLRALAPALAGAAGTFLLANPYALLNPRAFLRGFAFQAAMAVHTHPHTADRGARFYLDALFAQGWPFALAAALALGWALFRARDFARVLALFVLAQFAAFALMRTQADRYVLPALPFCCVLVGAALDRLSRARVPARARALPAALALALAALLTTDLARTSLPAAFDTRAPAEPSVADARAELQNAVLSRTPRGTTLWLEADVLPFVQATFADPGGGLQRAAREAVRRAYPRFDARVLKGESVEGLVNFEPALVESGRVDYAVTCERMMREAEHEDAGGARGPGRRAFYRALRAATAGVVYAGPMGCALYRVR